MSRQYLAGILTLHNLLSLSLLLFQLLLLAAHNPIHAIESFESITFTDSKGVEHEEFAFVEPNKGFPEHVIQMYCANVKIRYYWAVFREELKNPTRVSNNLRRLARFARHLFEEIRTVDKPFEGEMLSTIDSWYGVKLTDDDQRELDRVNVDEVDSGEDDANKPIVKKSKLAINSIRGALKKVRHMVKTYAPTALVGLYTRWRTMWWLMMSCLFAKYYLWDPALDEFIKLQRSLVMYPEFQLIKLQDIDCKPIKFFQRLLDTCKVLNPLMNIDFGQLSLDKMWQFKPAASE